jgi:hypothetical protein
MSGRFVSEIWILAFSSNLYLPIQNSHSFCIHYLLNQTILHLFKRETLRVKGNCLFEARLLLYLMDDVYNAKNIFATFFNATLHHDVIKLT